METESTPVIYIGKKNMSYYINVCLKLLDKGNKRFVIEGLGNNIRKAVDAANFLMILYKKGDLSVKTINIDLVEKGIVRGLPKKVSRIRIEIEKVE